MSGRGRGRGRGGGAMRSSNHRENGQGGSGDGRKAISLCNNFTMKKSCRFGAGCRFGHILLSAGVKIDAHNGAILTAEIGPLSPTEDGKAQFEIFTGGREDHCIKRWVLTSKRKVHSSTSPSVAASGGDPFSSLFPADATIAPNTTGQTSGNVEFDIKLDATTSLEGTVCKLLLAADCLFCGLSTGVVQGFHRASGGAFSLLGHTREIQALVLVDNILISADFGGALRFWRPQLDANGSPGFECVQTMQADWSVSVVKPVSSPSTGRRLLFVGGVQRLGVLDLQSMQWINHVEVSKPKSVCVDVLQLEQIYIAIFSMGEVKILSEFGEEQRSMSTRTEELVLAAQIIEQPGGAHMILGLSGGAMQSRSLPSLNLEWTFVPHDDHIRRLLKVEDNALAPTFFSASADGCFGLWTYT